MSDPLENNTGLELIEQEAAAWVLRSDRGLSPSEQDELSQWLGSDPRHGVAMRKYRGHWKRLDRLGQWLPEHSMQPNPDLLAPPLRQRMVRFLPATMGLAAAAAVVFGFVIWRAQVTSALPKARVAETAAPEELRRVLEDGSVIELNTGAIVTEHFTPGERRVELVRGEAHFAVAKNPHRPFIVTAHGVNVHAVGTAFNVRLDSAVVEVLVTEGRVQVKTPPADVKNLDVAPATQLSDQAVSVLDARQRAVVSLTHPSEAPQIATLTSGEIERVLAWQHRLLDFTAAPLSEIVAEFNRRNGVQIVLADRELESVRISASFRSDNVDGFVHLIETAPFGVQAERRGKNEIILRKAR